MDLSERIIEHEGIRLKVYKDHLGYDTIGVGRLLSNGITHDEAMYMLDNDIKRVKTQVNTQFPWIIALNDARKDVLYEMCFQLGINRLSLFKNMITACRDGDFDKASAEMINSVWHKQTPKRCELLAKIMREGK